MIEIASRCAYEINPQKCYHYNIPLPFLTRSDSIRVLAGLSVWKTKDYGESEAVSVSGDPVIKQKILPTFWAFYTVLEKKVGQS